MSKEVIENYFESLLESLKDVLPENLFNYYETNLTDDPTSKTVTDLLNVSSKVYNKMKSCVLVCQAIEGLGIISCRFWLRFVIQHS